MQLLPSTLVGSEAAGRDDVDFDLGYPCSVGERAGLQDLPLSFVMDLSEATFFMFETIGYDWSWSYIPEKWAF
jgi:hypothetical protein